MKSVKYLAMWDCYGLECIFNLTKWEQDAIWAKLKDEPSPKLPSLQTLLLRARYNSQRHYEIYIFNTDDTLSEKSVKEAFEHSPQFMADFIRKNGHCLFSGRETKEKVIT